MPVSYHLILAVHLPLVGFLLLLFFGRRMGRGAGVVATGIVLGSLGLSIAAMALWVAKDTFNQPHYMEAANFRWLVLAGTAGTGPVSSSGGGGSAISVGYYIDSLTVAMFVLVTFIGSLVHLFSISWMNKEWGGGGVRGRYFACLNLFVFAALAAILSNSLVQMLACWEVAAAASFFLISFWYEKRGPAMGALKFGILQAIGDAAFLLAIGILIVQAGTAALNFSDGKYETMTSVIWRAKPPVSPISDAATGGSEVLPALPSTTPNYFAPMAGRSMPGGGGFLGLHWLKWVGLLLFAGAAAKAAQFPLHAWMPEAMESPGPTPALVHGTVFVAMGVYLVARIYPLLALTPDVQLAIAIIGCITLLMGALLAMVQTNLRQILAYGAMSQAGYVMLFLGVRGYTAGLVHLVTQSFVSACLFLAAACVVYGLKGTQDIRQMGGLWRKLPLTALGFLVATLAMIGVPFFSGAYSRGMGLAVVLDYAQRLAGTSNTPAAMMLFYVPAATCFLTAFYLGRCWWLVFAGKSRNEDLAEGAHEPFVMELPMGMLAVLSWNVYDLMLLPRLLNKSLAGDTPVVRSELLSEGVEAMLMGRRGGYAYWGFLGAVLAVMVYSHGLGRAERLRGLPVLNLVHLWLRERMFLDAIYGGVLLRVVLVASAVASFVDRYVLEAAGRLVLAVVRLVAGLGAAIDERVIDGVSRGFGWMAGAVAGQIAGGEDDDMAEVGEANRPVKRVSSGGAGDNLS